MIKKTYKNVRNVLLLFIGFFFLDFFVGIIGGYLKSKLPDFGENQTVKTNYVTTKLKSDILIYGASTAEHNYISSIIKYHIDTLLNVQYDIYNAGIDGQFLNFQCCEIECLLNRSKPKILIWDVKDKFFCAEDLQLVNFSPYFNENTVVNKYIKQGNKLEYYKLFFNNYKYRGAFLKYLESLRYIGYVDSLYGYVPKYNVMKETQLKNSDNSNKKVENINPIIETNFRHVIDLCKQKNVLLLIVSSPVYGELDENPIIAKICHEKSVPFINLSNIDYFNKHPEFFVDPVHLNHKGAVKFTNYLCSECRKFLFK